MEQFHIARLKSLDRRYGFNLAPIAGSMLGYKHSAETRAKMSAIQKGSKKPMSPEARAGLVARLKGKKRSPETCAKMSATLKANHTPERSAAIRARNLARSPEEIARIRALSDAPEAKARHLEAMKGVRLSPEVFKKKSAARWAGDARERMSAVHKGKKLSPEHVEKVAASKRGKKASAELRKKLSDAHKGYVMPQSQKDAIRAANTGRKRSEETKAKLRAVWATPERREAQRLSVLRIWEKRKAAASI